MEKHSTSGIVIDTVGNFLRGSGAVGSGREVGIYTEGGTGGSAWTGGRTTF